MSDDEVVYGETDFRFYAEFLFYFYEFQYRVNPSVCTGVPGSSQLNWKLECLW